MNPEIQNALLIHNPNAGNGGNGRRSMLDEARRIFRQAGIETEIQETTAPGEATILARRAVEESRQLAIVCGGDGTVNEAVNGLACSQVPLAVLPSGTANVLAKELGLPWNLPRAADGLIDVTQSKGTIVKATGLVRSAATGWQDCGALGRKSVVELILVDVVERDVKAGSVGYIENIETKLQGRALR